MTAVASTWAASWRINCSAGSPLLAVTIEILAPSGNMRDRSTTSPSPLAAALPTCTASAARASPGPIAAAASPPVAPSCNSSRAPSGSVTVTAISACRLSARRLNAALTQEGCGRAAPLPSGLSPSLRGLEDDFEVVAFVDPHRSVAGGGAIGEREFARRVRGFFVRLHLDRGFALPADFGACRPRFRGRFLVAGLLRLCR